MINFFQNHLSNANLPQLLILHSQIKKKKTNSTFLSFPKPQFSVLKKNHRIIALYHHYYYSNTHKSYLHIFLTTNFLASLRTLALGIQTGKLIVQRTLSSKKKKKTPASGKNFSFSRSQNARNYLIDRLLFIQCP